VSDAVQSREVARRLFAAEFDDATLSYSEGEEERAPNYVVTPTGARTNRLFAVGALTEVDSVSEDVLRGRIADPTGVFVTYAGQYQPDAAGFLERASPPCFVSLTGKARTYQPEDADRIFTSVRPESINEVDADTRDRWVVAAAEATLERVATTAAALELDVRGEDLRAALESRGVDAALAQGVALAVDHYEPTEHYLEALRRMAVQALELVAGERDAVDAPDVAPNVSGPDELGPLPDVAAASAVDSPPDGDAVEAVDDVEAAGAETIGAEAADAETAIDEETAEERPPTAGGVDEDAVETTESPDASEAADAAESPDDLGDFGAEETAESKESPGAADDADELYELDEEERAEIEAEYGTEFATGNEVDDPGEADIDVPDVEELDAESPSEPAGADESEADDLGPGDADSEVSDVDDAGASVASPEETADADTEASDVDAEADVDTDAEADVDVDLEDAAVSVMADLDDGDGADREAVVAAVVEEYGVDPDDVEDAIQEALMDGKCYEPAEGTLKAI